MPVARPDSGETRVIAHLDLDCFYVQGSFLSHLCFFEFPNAHMIVFCHGDSTLPVTDLL